MNPLLIWFAVMISAAFLTRRKSPKEKKKEAKNTGTITLEIKTPNE